MLHQKTSTSLCADGEIIKTPPTTLNYSVEDHQLYQHSWKKEGMFHCENHCDSRSGSSPIKIFSHWFESPAFKRAPANSDWVQTSDQVKCHQNVSNYINLPSLFNLFATIKASWVCSKCIRSDFCNICLYYKRVYSAYLLNYMSGYIGSPPIWIKWSKHL